MGEYTSRLLSESRGVRDFERIVIGGPYTILYYIGPYTVLLFQLKNNISNILYTNILCIDILVSFRYGKLVLSLPVVSLLFVLSYSHNALTEEEEISHASAYYTRSSRHGDMENRQQFIILVRRSTKTSRSTRRQRCAFPCPRSRTEISLFPSISVWASDRPPALGSFVQSLAYS